MSLLTFREKLVFSLTGLHPVEPICEIYRPFVHYLEKTSEMEGKKNKRRKRHTCKSCYQTLVQEKGREFAKKKAPMVLTYCKRCPKKPYL